MVLPMPMNASCNKFVSSTHEDHAKACEYAALVLTVWSVDRSKFEQFHHWLLEPRRPPPLDEAERYAARLVGHELPKGQRRKSLVDKRIREYTKLFGTAGAGRIPKMMWDTHVVSGPFSNSEHLFDLFETLMKIRARTN